MRTKTICKINGPVVIAEGEADFAMHEIVSVGAYGLMGEVIKIDGNCSTIQVYEETSGMKIGENVEGLNESLSIYLGPRNNRKCF
jgi:V/A-type H+-transporting ATPase subunit A